MIPPAVAVSSEANNSTATSRQTDTRESDETKEQGDRDVFHECSQFDLSCEEKWENERVRESRSRRATFSRLG